MDNISRQIDYLKTSRWVQSPPNEHANELVRNVTIPDFVRGEGKAKDRLDYLESIFRARMKEFVDLDCFPNFYFVNGVTDAINQWLSTETRQWYYLQGDYEYARQVTKDGESCNTIYSDSSKVLYISNPSAFDGNFHCISHINGPVILDCAYIGSTQIQPFDIPIGTEQVFFSFSKGWSQIGQRLGVIFTKTPHQSLHLMKAVECWNYTGVEMCIKLLQEYSMDDMHNLYKEKQQQVCSDYNLTPSDCFFIATSTDEQYRARRRVASSINTLARLNLFQLLQL